MWALDDVLRPGEAAASGTVDTPGVSPDTSIASSLTEEPTGSQSHNDPTASFDAEIAHSVSLEEYIVWDLGTDVGSPIEYTTPKSSSLMSDTDLWANCDGQVADDDIRGRYEDPYIPPDTGAPLLSDNPTPWACNAAVAGPSTFAGALGHAGDTAGVDNARPVTDRLRRDHVSLAIDPGLLHAEQGSITNEYAAILDDDGWDEEDVIESDYEEVAEDDKDDAPITHDADEPTTFGEDDEHFPATEDGAIITDDERRSVEFHPIAFPIEGRVTRLQAALSRNASSTRPNDKGKRRASPEPCDKESTQSPTTSGKRKEPSDPRDDEQDVPPRRNYTGGNIGTGNWKCLEPKCTRKYRREADMKRHWQWECVVRNPKLLKVVLCEYCGKRCRNLFMANALSCGVRPASSSKYREQGLRSIFEWCGQADKKEDFVSRVGDGEDERWRYARCRDHVCVPPAWAPDSSYSALLTRALVKCHRRLTVGPQ
ncbi:hypothetical protein IEO21_07933 [Rhodonia placenta]|uniref:Uncharacterized protein n=1 Tax=Rhodonia placenta TaxID=104341 RepID=A0A8H7NXK8_9APHY|nr:hypothetical protein IEO21_07933 [Postia placenta]